MSSETFSGRPGEEQSKGRSLWSRVPVPRVSLPKVTWGWNSGADREHQLRLRSTIQEFQIGQGKESPFDIDDMGEILQWMKDPTVRGHLYPNPNFPDLNDGEVTQEKKESLLEYYLGAKDENEQESDPANSTFIRVINKDKEMIAVATLRWRGVDFITPNRRKAYLCRVIVKPELQGMGIGSAVGVRARNYAFDEFKGYQGGQGASELKASEIVGGSPETRGFDRNHFWLRSIGFKQDGPEIPIPEEDLIVQPWKFKPKEENGNSRLLGDVELSQGEETKVMPRLSDLAA